MFSLSCSTLISGSALSLDRLASVACQLQGFAWAESSQRPLCTMQKIFIDFLNLHDLNQLPVHGDTLVCYATFLVYSGRLKAVSSVKQYISAASTLHKMHGLPCDTPLTYGPLDQVLRGIERSFARPKRKRLPVTAAILANLISDLNRRISHTNNLAQKSFLTAAKAMYILLFFSMLRGGNVVPSSYASFDPARHLSWGRIENHPKGIIISIPLSKTIQNSERVHQIPLVTCSNPYLCPVTALQEVFEMRGADLCSSSAPVIARFSNGGWTPVLKSAVVRLFDQQIAEMGLDPRDYAVHSFRIGGLQHALLSKIPIDIMRSQSDHSSQAIMGYLHLPVSQRFSISETMSAGFADLIRE